jgi:hypothetical protein
MAQLIYSSLFGELTRNVQARIDAASLKHKQLFDQNIYEKYLDWDTPTIGLNFEELIGKYNITVAAPTIGDDSKEALLDSYGLETFASKVLKHAITRPMTASEYRKVMALLDSKSITDAEMKKALVDVMWGMVTEPVNSVKGKIDMIFLGALSNCGVFTFDANNNPEGGVRGNIDFNMPAENIATADTQWTEANIETVDCFADIQDLIDAAEDKGAIDKLLIAPSRLSYMLRTKKMKQVIFGTDKQNSPLTLTLLNEFMQSNGLPVFEKIRRQIKVKNGKTLTTVTPWNAKNIVAIPAGKLGIIKNAYADSELKQESGVAYSNYGRIRVSQWGVGETQGSNGVEFAKAESRSLPVITEIEGIYTLKTEK